MCSTQCFGISYVNIYIIYKYANFICESFVLQNSRVLHNTGETQLLKGYSNSHKTANWNLWPGHQDTSFTLQKDVMACNVNADCHFISSFIKRPLFKEEPHERRISGNEPTEISMLPLDVLILKLSRKTRKHMSIIWKICLEDRRKRHSVSRSSAQVWSGYVQSVPSPTHDLSVLPGNAECHMSPSPCDGKPSSSRAPMSCHTCTYTKARATVGHLYPAIAEWPLLQAVALVRLTEAPCTGSSVEDLPQAIRTEDPSNIVGFNASFNSPKNHGMATFTRSHSTLNCPPHPFYNAYGHSVQLLKADTERNDMVLNQDQSIGVSSIQGQGFRG